MAYAAVSTGLNSITRYTEEAEVVLRDPSRSHREVGCLCCGKWKEESHVAYSKGHPQRMVWWNDAPPEDKMEWTMDFYKRKATCDQNLRELRELFGHDPEALHYFDIEVNKLQPQAMQPPAPAPAAAANAGPIVPWMPPGLAVGPAGAPPPPPAGAWPGGGGVAPPGPPPGPNPNNGAGQAAATNARRWQQQSHRTPASSDGSTGSTSATWQVVPARAPTADLAQLLDRIAALEARVDALEAPPPAREWQ